MVTPLVVAVSVTVNAVPAVRVPAAGATVNDGGAGVVAWTADVGPELQLLPTRASTVYVYVVEAFRPLSWHVNVLPPTVHTVAVDGAVRCTTYCVGATLGAPGAAQLMLTVDQLVALAPVAVGRPTDRAADEPVPALAGDQTAPAVTAEAMTTSAVTTRARKAAVAPRRGEPGERIREPALGWSTGVSWSR
jgi:hypothetical protein